MDPHSISGGCATALHAAVALTEDTAVVTALLQGAADANARDPYGTPVLHPAAAPTPDLKVIASLFATNADIDARIANGRLYANRGRGDRSRRPRRQKTVRALDVLEREPGNRIVDTMDSARRVAAGLLEG